LLKAFLRKATQLKTAKKMKLKFHLAELIKEPTAPQENASR